MYPLEIHDLTVSYHKKPVLYGVDLAIPAGLIVGIMGPNGAGKSTLIKTIMGLIKPSRGWVKIFGSSIQKGCKRVGYVPQRESVDWDFPVNVKDTVMMGRYGKLGLFKRPGKQDHAIVEDCLRKVGMENYADRQISKLSGGQQQRVFLARALAQESDLYFMDEPFVGVDASTEAAIMRLLQDLKTQGKSIIVVHHDIVTAKHYFDKIALINMRLVAYDDTAKILEPAILEKAYGARLSILSDVAQIDAQML